MANNIPSYPRKSREGEEARILLFPYKHLRQGRLASQRNEEEKLGVLDVSMFPKLELTRRKVFSSTKIKAPTKHKDHKILGSEGK